MNYKSTFKDRISNLFNGAQDNENQEMFDYLCMQVEKLYKRDETLKTGLIDLIFSLAITTKSKAKDLVKNKSAMKILEYAKIFNQENEAEWARIRAENEKKHTKKVITKSQKTTKK